MNESIEQPKTSLAADTDDWSELDYEDELDNENWDECEDESSKVEGIDVEKFLMEIKIDSKFKDLKKTKISLNEVIRHIAEYGNDEAAFKSAKEKGRAILGTKWFGDFPINALKLAQIMRCRYFIDETKDSKLAMCYDTLTNELYLVNLKKHLSLLPGKTAFINFMQTSVSVCSFHYEPYYRSLTIPKENSTFGLNTYCPPDWLAMAFYKGAEVRKSNVLPYLYQCFFYHLVDNDEKSYQALIKWIAHSLKFRNPTALVMVGEKGVGKTVLGAVLMKLHGDHNSKLLGPDFMKGKFNSEIGESTFVYFDEAYIDRNSIQEMNRFKLLVNDKISVEAKYQNPIVRDNFSNLYLSGNDYEGIPLEENNRRLTMVKCTDVSLIDFFKVKLSHFKIEDLFKESNIKMLGEYLYSMELNIDDMRVPYVDKYVANKVLIATSKEWEVWAVDWLMGHQLHAQLTLSDNYTVDIKIFQDELKKMFPDWDKRVPGRNALVELVKKYDKLLCKVKKYPTLNTETGGTYFYWSKSLEEVSE